VSLCLVAVQTCAQEVPVTNLALARIPVGSSDSYEASFRLSTDGSIASAHVWRAASFESPSYLQLDLGAPASVTSMNITAGVLGFKVLSTYRSNEPRAWKQGYAKLNFTLVRREVAPWQCRPGSTTEHNGWPEVTRYIFIQMEGRCTEQPIQVGTAEWRVFGYYPTEMVRKYEKTWPLCIDLGQCFEYINLEDAKSSCIAKPSCDGFSFSAASINGGFGGGCYKTQCRNDGGNGYGRSRWGYWEKRRGGPR